MYDSELIEVRPALEAFAGEVLPPIAPAASSDYSNAADLQLKGLR